jgi:hypothetical protein
MINNKEYNQRKLLQYISWKLKEFFKNPVIEIKLNIYKLRKKKSNLTPEQYLELKFKILKTKKSDINEHLETLFENAKSVESVFETGVRGVVSSWAFLYGLHKNNSSIKKIFLNDISECDVNEISIHAKKLNIKFDYFWGNNLDLELSENFDLIFIDTWHVYAQLKRELDKFSRVCNKTIILHDTTIDAEYGESIRFNWDIKKQAKETGFPIEEISKGLWPAVEDFLSENKDWILKKRYKNNNGLTILERVQSNT